MSEANTRYTNNPETGRRIRIGGVTFNRLTFESHDFINGELVRRETAPPPAPRIYYYNTVTERLIRYGTRTYFELIRAGWEIEEDYYLMPPSGSLLRHEVDETLAMIQNVGQEIAQRRNAQNLPLPNYENIMAVHGERLANLNITLCRECLYAIKPEDGEYCNDCRPE
jgi:hypothetical protein